MDFFKHNRVYDFVKMSNYGIILSLILFVGSLILFIKPGFNLGVDFAGGTIVQVQYKEAAPLSEIRKTLEAVEAYNGVQVSEFGAPEEILIKLPTASSSVNQDIGQEVANVLKNTGALNVRRVDIVGPKVGDELKEKGTLALILALVSIMFYVSYRYEWRFALAAILALVHDVVIAAGAVVLFNIDLSLEVIAALLTLIGYSINDTIIIFDRIRETIGIRVNDSLENVINEALSATLSRTVLTSLTVFFTVFTLYAFGGEIIKGFSLPMLVGSIVGSYSSIFVASKLVILFKFDLKKYYQKVTEAERKALEKKKMREMYERGRV
ncbi:protein translocase subunit SecF [Helicobacter turcicus]|uniref:Protein-export membrane protein SecF n=1 Tax=Helicobacter turcicus TaxID=2867412 RepID=A0ABS7JPK8_9HELI|nr:protein translocase subunit SecF [Helicobacter turcicus]MBX7491332.1 protein translocase subunit SecF [Helicobacter turcicus]MBX7546181.1 protein translocase subunit SecF [Helicobacter turcicus]